MQAAMALRTGLLLLLAGLLATAVACIPKPNQPIDYLAIDEAVIIQRKTVADPASELDQRSTTPDFTLYGDGTLLVTQPSGDSAVLLVTELGKASIESLLAFIVDRGFMDISYDQSGGGPGPTTYLYVQTQELANSVAVSVPSLAATDASGEARALARIFARLDEDARAALDAKSIDYQPVAGTLYWETVDGADPAQASGWPVEIDLLDAERRLPGRDVFLIGIQAPQAAGWLDPANSAGHCWRNVLQASRVINACLLPDLPNQRNFPEFDLPAP